jgi:UDP-N-acetylmuramyl tripeptide synthase
MANEGDYIIIAGKGHEKTQKIGNIIFEFNDKKEAQNAIYNRLKSSKVESYL